MKARTLLTALAAAAFFVGSAQADVTVKPLVEVSTPLGDIILELDPDAAPITVANFLQYIEDGDFADSFFHRADPGFVIQGGGYTIDNTDTFGTVDRRDAITNEYNQSNLRGTIAMARQGGVVDSATSEWFVNLGDNSGLDTVDEGFTVFGRVTQGMDVVDAIAGLQIINYGGVLNELPILPTSAPPTVERNEVVLTEYTYLNPNVIPEPSSAALLALGGLVLMRRRRG